MSVSLMTPRPESVKSFYMIYHGRGIEFSPCNSKEFAAAAVADILYIGNRKFLITVVIDGGRYTDFLE